MIKMWQPQVNTRIGLAYEWRDCCTVDGKRYGPFYMRATAAHCLETLGSISSTPVIFGMTHRIKEVFND